MPRPTREFKTSGGHVIVQYDYITGREQRAIQEVFLRNVEISRLSQADGKTDAGMTGFSAAVVSEAQDLSFKLLIVSMDGTNDDVVSRILDLPAIEFGEVVAAINEVTETKKK
jgi:hypothetical protein